MNATVEKILSVKNHPNADRLDLVQVLGYQCVTQKEMYKENDIIIYIRPDAILPEEDWATEYRKYSPKRIKAVRLRNEWSEGIIVPIELVKSFLPDILTVGQDVSELLNVKHYEPPVPQQLDARGLLPYNIPKTDEKRWEELMNKLPFNDKIDVTLKVDGQSWSAYYNLETDDFGVLSRNLEYKIECQNNYTNLVFKHDIQNKLINYCKENNVSLCIRGESYGEGIQSLKNNYHSKLEKNLALFSVYNITEKKYERKGSKFYFINVAKDLNLPTVEILENDVLLTQELINKYSVELTAINDNPFEGVVIQHSDMSFKIINKDYDSKK